jgi:C-terminal processing protease CtpA/Prc
MTRFRLVLMGWTALCLGVCLSVAPAADEPAAAAANPPSIPELIKRLTHEDFGVREQATEQLMSHATFDEKALRKAFKVQIHPEVRNRLMKVAKHRFFQQMATQFAVIPGDRGALGIRLSPNNRSDPTQYVLYPSDHPSLPNAALVIAQTIPGFPAHIHLRRGDLVIGVNGKPLTDALTDQDFIARLAPQRKGQKLAMRIVRDGKTREIDVEMGSYTQLINLTYGVQYASRRAGEEGLDMFDAYPPWQQHLKDLLQRKTPPHDDDDPGDV